MAIKREEKVKEYDVPDDVMESWTNYTGIKKLRDEYIRRNFFGSWKKAARAAKLCEKNRLNFWYKIRCIYPELADFSLIINEYAKTVSISIKEEDDVVTKKEE